MERPTAWFSEKVAECSFCLDLNPDYLRRQPRRFGYLPPKDIPYGFILSKLERNARRKNCHGCKLVLRAAEKIKTEHGLDFRHAQFEFLDGEKDGELRGLSLSLSLIYPRHDDTLDLEALKTNPGPLKINVATCPNKDDPTRKWEWRISSPVYELFRTQEPDQAKSFVRASDSKWEALVTRPSRCGDTESDAAVQWTASQVEHCCNNHDLCEPQDSDSHQLPTRLLDLGPDLSDLTANPRLYIAHASEEAEYFCLSHCWGIPGKHNPPLETTRQNISEFLERIPWERLPKTFQDAVIFTRKSGIRYLWIDSLCIIQKDAADWMNEAGKMAAVYENAKLTLAAAASTNSYEGLFRTCSPAWSLESEEEGQPWAKGLAMRLYPLPKFFEYNQLGRKLADQTQVSPLLQRAWVYQERILSRRVLYFTPLELVLECMQSNVAESGQRWIDSTAKHDFNDRPGTTAERSLKWRVLMEEFTNLKLTRASDTLPAVAGLAKRLLLPEECEKDSYLAGLWRSNFLQEMLWFRRNGARSPKDKHAANPHVPSWSWAKTDAPKSFIMQALGTPLCNVSDVGVDSANGEDIFLRVDSGHVTISGYLLKARYTKTGVNIDGVKGVYYYAEKDYGWSEPNTADEVVNEGDRLYVLPVAVQPAARGYGEIPALVLRALADGDERQDGQPRTFQRVGLLNTSLLLLQSQNTFILEDRDLLVATLKKDIAFGESMLESDGTKRGDVDEHASSRSSRYNVSKDLPGLKGFRNDANTIHYFKTRGQVPGPESTFNDFFGTEHHALLKETSLEEERRIAEWKKRKESGKEQAQKRDLIRIV
ncbi:HET-domain-containing protein [Podospora australis]|uniref:HET-domain-containing protein n=1 Tax=Podospora australis TaxID=1536484 RepID=A0AAN7AKA0_9PEZI|nr:HET-domain-containing protein [Podospora australis]